MSQVTEEQTSQSVASSHNVASHWATTHSQTERRGQDLNLKTCIACVSSAQARTSPQLFLPPPQRGRNASYFLQESNLPLFLPPSFMACPGMLSPKAWQVSAGEAGKSHTVLTYKGRKDHMWQVNKTTKYSISSQLSRRNLSGIFLEVESVVHDAFPGSHKITI